MNKHKIKNEIEKILYLYKMKKIIRFNEHRIEKISTESDAEHIFGMMILTNYFLTLPEYKNKYNKQKIYDLILFHEIDELETGDIYTFIKTKKDKEIARKSLEIVYQKIPTNLTTIAKNVTEEMEYNKTKESKFVFWIDKIEPMFHLYFDIEMAKKIFKKTKLDYRTARAKKDNYIKNSGVIKDFLDIIFEKLEPYYYKDEN